MEPNMDTVTEPDNPVDAELLDFLRDVFPDSLLIKLPAAAQAAGVTPQFMRRQVLRGALPSVSMGAETKRTRMIDLRR
jgi:hypothetical protein